MNRRKLLRTFGKSKRSTKTSAERLDYFRALLEPLEERHLLSSVTWTVTESLSDITLIIPDQSITLGGLTGTAQMRNQNGSSPWTTNVHKTTGTINTDYVDGSSIEFIGGSNSVTAVPIYSVRPNPAQYHDLGGTSGLFIGTSSDPAAWGARVQASGITGGYMSLDNLSYDLDSGPMPISSGTFPIANNLFVHLAGMMAVDGTTNPLFGQLFPDTLIALEDSFGGLDQAAHGTVTNLGGAERRLTIPMFLPIPLELDGQTLYGTITGQIAATATVVAPDDFSEFRVNTYTTNDQSDAAVAMDADGNFVVVWTSKNQDGSGDGVYARRFNAAGVPQQAPGEPPGVTEFRVNTYTTGGQLFPTVAMDAEGNFVVAWNGYNESGYGLDIYAKRYNAAGDALQVPGEPGVTEFRVNTYTPRRQEHPSVAMDSEGNVVVAWDSSDQFDHESIYARRFNAAGIAQQVPGEPEGITEFQVSDVDLPSDQFVPSVAMNSEGDFVVVWTKYGFGYHVRGKRYNAAGVAQQVSGEPPGVTQFEVDPDPSNEDQEDSPSAAMDSEGNFVVVWTTVHDDYSYDAHGQRYNAVGVAQQVPGEAPGVTVFKVAADTTNAGSDPSVAMDAEGEFVVAWESEDVSGWRIDAQRYNAAGDARHAFQVNVDHDGINPSVAMNALGDFVVAWSSAEEEIDAYARRYEGQLPIVTRVSSQTGEAIDSEVPVAAAVTSLTVQFSEAMSTTGGTTGTSSVTNPENYQLLGGTTDVSDLISGITYGSNSLTGHYEATLALSSPLQNGSYQVVVRGSLHAVAGSKLDGNDDAQPGGDFVLPFKLWMIGLSANVVSENQSAGTLVGTLSIAELDAGDTFTYSLVEGVGSSGNGSFAIVGNQLQTAAVLHHEIQSSYSIRVRGADQNGLYTERVFFVDVLVSPNNAPVIDLGNAPNYSTTWNYAPVAIENTATAIATDSSGTLASMTVALSATHAGNVLAANTSGTPITQSWNGTSLVLSGVTTAANYQQVLRTITYNNTLGGSGVASETATFTAVDADGTPLTSAPAVATITITPGSTLTGARTFYNNSVRYDTVGGPRGPLAVANDNAIATDKSAYLPGGGTANFGNYTSYSRGVNGIMVDLKGGGNHASITLANILNDFTFRVGGGGTGSNTAVSTWVNAPLPTTVNVRTGMTGAAQGAGTVSGSDRVELIWADGAITQKWLEVIVKATPNTGLASNTAFLYGNAPGNTAVFNTATVARTGASDVSGAQTHGASLATNIPISNIYDFDRDGKVNANDVSVAQTNGTSAANGLKLNLNLSSTGPFAPDALPSASPALSLGDVGGLLGLQIRSLPSIPPALLNRLGNLNLDLNTGPIAKYFEKLAHEATDGAKRILKIADEVADFLHLDHDLLDSLCDRLGIGD